jgi:ABC-type nitrate/sulfonate/bicarbonate transport system permease component
MDSIAEPLRIEATAPTAAVEELSRQQVRRRGRAVKLASLFALLASWQLIAILNTAVAFYNPRLFPSPADIAVAGWKLAQTGELQRHTIVSLERIAAGFLLAVPIGILLGICVARIRWIENLIEPAIEALRPIPVWALLPIFILWFGIGEQAKVIFISYSCFFVIFTTTVLGVRNVDPILIRAGESLGLNRIQIYRHVILQSAFPDIMVGIRLGLSVCFTIIVAAEFIAADTGLGYLINYSKTWFRVDNMMVGAILIGVLGVVSNYLLLAVEQRLFRWRPTSS